MPTGKARRKTSAKKGAAGATINGASPGVILKRILDERGMTAGQFTHLVYGKNNPTAYTVLRDPRANIAQPTADRWEEALSLPVGTFKALGREFPARVVRQEKPPPRPPDMDHPPVDQFSLVINSRGMATVKVDLVDIPVDAAMRLINAMSEYITRNPKIGVSYRPAARKNAASSSPSPEHEEVSHASGI